MATERKPIPEQRFIRGILPWIIAAATLALYVLTLNHWVSFGNLAQVARLSGWSWYADLYAPVNFLLTLPIGLLPAKFVPVGLNLLAAICAALALAQLARSVALLPHDRTHEQREKERGPLWLLSIPTAWLPPVIAVIACGLELSFWEYGTAANCADAGVEMIDLLMFAYIIRCLLEFRVSQRESWLYQAALVCGAGASNNWAIIGFTPVFLTALIWIRGLAFFNVRFLTRMFLWVLLGLSLYLLLPIRQSFSDISNMGFWQALKINLGTQYLDLKSIKVFLFYGEKPLWVLGLYSLLPILAISIRWPSYFGDTSKLGIAIATFTFHLVHGALLLLCAWVALDAPISPRNHTPGLPSLTLYYLSALNLGYLVGYFLLVFRSPPNAPRKPGPFLLLLNRVIILTLWIICLFLPVALFYKNLPQIRFANGPTYKHFAAAMARSLPERNTVVLSDDLTRLMFLQAFTAQTGATNRQLYLFTRDLEFTDYHRFLRKRYAQLWPVNPGKDARPMVHPYTLRNVFSGLSATNDIYYLHPSFGYYFEVFYPEVHGLVFKLNVLPTNAVTAPVASPELLKENDRFWEKADTEVFNTLTNATAPGASRISVDPLTKFLKLIHVSRQPNREATDLAQFYSRALDYWAVEVQKTGNLPRAAHYFDRALQLNPKNLVAEINLKCNRLLQTGQHLEVRNPQSVLDEFGPYRDWNGIMNDNGPFDEPSFCYAEAMRFALPPEREGVPMYHQAACQFERVQFLAPAYLPARLWLANIYLIYRQPDEALRILDEIHANPKLLPIARNNQGVVLSTEASARLAKGDLAGANEMIDRTLKKYPGDDELLETAIKAYVDHKYLTNALPLLEQRIEMSPTNIDLYLVKSYAYMQAGRVEEAVPVLTHALDLQTNLAEAQSINLETNLTHNTLLLNRAIAYFKTDKLDESRQDYEAVQKNYPTSRQIFYGLGEIAYKNKDTNKAILYYQGYLTNAPDNAEEIKLITSRLKELRPGYP